MNRLTHFYDCAKQQFCLEGKKTLLPQTNKVAEQQNRIFAQENVGIGTQIAKGVLVLGGTVCSSFAAFVLFGKTSEELEVDAGVMERRIGRELLALPEVKTTLAPVSVFPTIKMATVISMFDLFFDSDGQSLILEAVEKGKQTLPSWMGLEASTHYRGAYNLVGDANGVHVVGNLAYVVDTTGLQILDVSNPSFPTLKGTYGIASSTLGVYVLGNLAYLAAGYNGLRIIDVSNPSSPTLKGSYFTSGYPVGVHVVGSLAYVADGYSGLLIIDVSNPSSPTLKGTYDTPGYARGVYVAQNLAYVADQLSGLQIIQVSNPISPTLIGTYDTSGLALGVYAAQNLAYVADDTSGLQIIDVSNPISPKLMGNYDTPDHASFVHVVQNLAYVADSVRGLQIIDVSNSSNPTLRGTYDTPGSASGVYALGYFVFVSDGASGLQIIENSFTLGGTPNQTQVGNYEIELIAKDPDQNQVSQSLIVRVEGPPVATSTFPNQLINVDAPFNYFVDQNVFSDPNDDVMFYSSKLEHQDPLPSWLSFSSIGIFSGTPRSSDLGTYNITVLAFDGISPQQVETKFSLVVDHFPKVATTISDHAADIGKLYSFSISSSGTFSDEDVLDVLTYNATLSNGSPLPSWLRFNGLVLSGTPTALDAGPLSITLSATDQAFAKAQTSFTLTVEHFPDLVTPIPNQLAGVGQDFTFVIPSNTYRDLDDDTLNLKATRSDGSVLPFWLGFNNLRQEFQGTPLASDKGVLGIKVSAEDLKGGQTATTFDLSVVDSLDPSMGNNPAPQVANPISNQIAQVNLDYRFVVPGNTFIDLSGDPLTLSALKANGQDLPNWLKFDAPNRTLAGKPGPGDTGAFSDKVHSLQICATDGNKQACSVFDLSVQGISNEERALSIFGPLGSAVGLSLAWYKKRGWLVNPFNKNKYDKGIKAVPIGQSFTYKFDVEVKKIKRVQAFVGKKIVAGIKVPKSLDEKGWCEWLKVDKEIRGGDLLPIWLRYDEGKNRLISDINPRQEDSGLYVVKAYGHGDVILEEIKLDVGGEGRKNEKMLELLIKGKTDEYLNDL